MKFNFGFFKSLAVGSLLATSVFADTELTVYTAVEAEDLTRYAAKFNESHPDIKINWVRDSTGIITAKLLAEKNNPQADVVWGLAGTSLLLLKSEGMLEPYAPAGVEKLDSKIVDGDNGCMGCCSVLQYCRGRESWANATNLVERFNRSSVLRAFDYAKSKLIWYRIS